MSRWLRRLLPIAGLLLSSCGWFHETSGWRGAVASQAGQLGYRNWIVIAEASFPAHSRPGVRQIAAGEDGAVILDEVLRTLERTEHVRPRIYLSRELRAVENDFAPGVDDYRERLQRALHGHEPTELEHQALLTLIEDVTKSFDVLVIRSSTALPYSSIFLELQPGYWDGESEARLRQQIERQRMEKLARPNP